jgi:hypothetical protein
MLFLFLKRNAATAIAYNVPTFAKFWPQPEFGPRAKPEPPKVVLYSPTERRTRSRR